MKKSMIFVLLLLVSTLAFAQDKPAPKEPSIAELKLQLAQKDLQIAQLQAQMLQLQAQLIQTLAPQFRRKSRRRRKPFKTRCRSRMPRKNPSQTTPADNHY